MKGANWQVLKGRRVRLWKDIWVSSITSGHPIPITNGAVNLEQIVDSIINHEAGAWDFDRISNVISAIDKMVIEGNQFSDPGRPDYLVWRAYKKGSYMVKSGYQWILGQRPSRAGPVGSINSNT